MSDETKNKTFGYYLQICEDKVPYLLKYAPYNPNSRMLAMLVGMMIDKEYLTL